jgi:hypothetical protein
MEEREFIAFLPGTVGDGKLFVLPVSRAICIYTDEENEPTLQPVSFGSAYAAYGVIADIIRLAIVFLSNFANTARFSCSTVDISLNICLR